MSSRRAAQLLARGFLASVVAVFAMLGGFVIVGAPSRWERVVNAAALAGCLLAILCFAGSCAVPFADGLRALRKARRRHPGCRRGRGIPPASRRIALHGLLFVAGPLAMAAAVAWAWIRSMRGR